MITLPVTDNDTATPAETEPAVELSAAVVPRAAVDARTADAMYALYARHYADTSARRFRSDLDGKTHVLLLTGGDGRLCGFSTIELYGSRAGGAEVRVIYSGDTIIDPAHWGNSALAFEWLRFAGRVCRQQPGVALYWLLIVKGHRTYRFLSTFARRYVPQHGHAVSEEEAALLLALAREKFGSRYDAHSGIVRCGPQSGRLTESLAEIPERHRRLPAVGYFLERNPGYRNGDELVCLCRLADDNLKPLARRAFAPSAGSAGA